MRKQDIAIILATLALLAVAGLVLTGQDPSGSDAAVAERESLPCEEPPLLASDGVAVDAGPRLGGGDQAVAAEVARLGDLVQRLEARMKTLEAENERLAAKVDPVADILLLLARERPKIERARQRSHQTAAIATLRNVTSAQAQMQATARIDQDNDGTGEYGGFRELSGSVPGRMSKVLVPPVLSSAFRTLNAYGEAERAGYLFRFYLPDAHGAGVGEPSRGFDNTSGVDSDLAETTWCAYAWPAEAGAFRTVFFMNQAGDVLVTEADYVGPGGGPNPDAAFVRAGAITGKTAVGARGSDGNVWTQAN